MECHICGTKSSYKLVQPTRISIFQNKSLAISVYPSTNQIRSLLKLLKPTLAALICHVESTLAQRARLQHHVLTDAHTTRLIPGGTNRVNQRLTDVL